MLHFELSEFDSPDDIGSWKVYGRELLIYVG